MKGKKHSEETKKKISKNNARYWLGKKRVTSKETREKRSKILKGRPRPQWVKDKIKKNSPRGKDHHNWKGDLVTKNRRVRDSSEYKLWRIAVFERDDYTCQNCLKRGGKLEAHHILPFAKYPELRLAINNGLTLCKKCHRG